MPLTKFTPQSVDNGLAPCAGNRSNVTDHIFPKKALRFGGTFPIREMQASPPGTAGNLIASRGRGGMTPVPPGIRPAIREPPGSATAATCRLSWAGKSGKMPRLEDGFQGPSYIVNGNGEIVKWYAAAERLLGWTEKQATVGTIWDLCFPDAHPTARLHQIANLEDCGAWAGPTSPLDRDNELVNCDGFLLFDPPKWGPLALTALAPLSPQISDKIVRDPGHACLFIGASFGSRLEPGVNHDQG